MRDDKQKALKLRLQGKSYTEINSILGVPKSTLSDWFATLEISAEVQQKISKRTQKNALESLLKRNKLQTYYAEQRARDIRERAKREVSKLSKNELFLVGVSLYWAEGYKRPVVIKGKIKTRHAVSLTNSDPYLVKMFLRFLREICKVPEEKITAGIRIYEHQNANYLLDFWSKTTVITPSKFNKFYYGLSKSSLGKKPFNILPYGTIQIRVNSTELYHKIMGWIDGLAGSN
ncbi:MAG: hypothetical protein FJZ43_02210 [Candidatus Staskawiczbacteria bacterium]|nr:hypothetical protein [Candidatus Staskawiczbacteria bacterium]